MKVIIAGGNRFAREIARNLIKRGVKDVTLIIEDKEDALVASSAVPAAVIVNASPAKPEVLNDLDLDACDVFIAVSKREEVSILAALYAKEHHVKRIYVKTSKEDTKLILENMDMHPIDVYKSASKNIVLEVVEPLISELVSVGAGSLDMRERNVAKHPNFIGKRLGDIEGKLFNIIAVYQDNKFEFSSDTLIKKDGRLIILEETGQEDKVDKELKKIK